MLFFVDQNVAYAWMVEPLNQPAHPCRKSDYAGIGLTTGGLGEEANEPNRGKTSDRERSETPRRSMWGWPEYAGEPN